MPICTYLSSADRKACLRSGDKDIDELLDEVRQKTGEEWLIEKVETTKRRWFRKPETVVRYTLYVDVFDHIEYQVINFCRDWDWSINTVVPKSCIVNYLHGYLGGIYFKERKPNG